MDGPSTSFPNPAVYLNHLDPNTAFEYEVTRNVYMAALGASHLSVIHMNIPDDMCLQAMAWDLLSCVQQDWKLLRISKPQPVFFAYHLSRWVYVPQALPLVLTFHYRLSTLSCIILSVLEYSQYPSFS